MKEERVEGGDLPEAGPSSRTDSKRETIAVSAQQSSFIGYSGGKGG